MITVRKHELESIAVIIMQHAMVLPNAAIEKTHATVVNKCFWILCLLLVFSNPVKAFNSVCPTSRKRVMRSEVFKSF